MNVPQGALLGGKKPASGVRAGRTSSQHRTTPHQLSPTHMTSHHGPGCGMDTTQMQQISSCWDLQTQGVTHGPHTRACSPVYLTDVVREVDFQSRDQETFCHQLLKQRFNGPGERADGGSVSTRTTLPCFCSQHTRRELHLSPLRRTFVHMQRDGFVRHLYTLGIN